MSQTRLPAQQGPTQITERRLPSDPAAAARAIAVLKRHPGVQYLGVDWAPNGSHQLVRYVELGQTVTARPIDRPAPAPRRNRTGLIVAGSVLAVLAALCGGGYLWFRSMSPGEAVITLACVVGFAAIVWAARSRSAPSQGGTTFYGTFKGTFK